MTAYQLPWVELSAGVSLAGAAGVMLRRDPARGFRVGLAVTTLAFLGTLLAWLAVTQGQAVDPEWDVQTPYFGWRVFALDAVSAPLFPLVGLLHLLTIVATTRTKMNRNKLAAALATEAILLATFSCQDAWVLIALLAAGTLPPLIELVVRKKSPRVYLIHMALFLALLVVGWWGVERNGGHATWAIGMVLGAVLVRSGTCPAHCWITDLFENASFGMALVTMAPLAGVYLAIRLVLPFAPDWVLEWIGVLSLATAVYAAGMATVQKDVRRFFAYLFLSHSSLVLVGLELTGSHKAEVVSLTGSLSLWVSVAISVGGFGLTLRAIESRFGRLSLGTFHGLYDSSPMLAVCFLLTGLGSVGFPGTLGFVATEMVVDGAVETNLTLGLAVVVAAALNGIAVVRAYLALFTGARHISTLSTRVGLRERLAVLTLAALILGGGLYPQPGVDSRHAAAVGLLETRQVFQAVENPEYAKAKE